jgi:hypothetical protein
MAAEIDKPAILDEGSMPKQHGAGMTGRAIAAPAGRLCITAS